MINSKKDLKYYIECDEIARFGEKVGFFEKMKTGSMWKYNVVLRKLEYSTNCLNGLNKLICRLFLKLRKKILEQITGWYIPENVFGPGLCVVHKGPVIVNHRARFGSNVRINAMVNIGASAGRLDAPVCGNRIYIGPGAKLFGDIRLGSNVAIGANAVVNKSFEKSNITIAGVPAKIVADHGCDKFVIDALEVVKNVGTNN